MFGLHSCSRHRPSAQGVIPGQVGRVTRLGAAGCHVVLQALADALQVSGQARVVEVEALSGLIGALGTGGRCPRGR